MRFRSRRRCSSVRSRPASSRAPNPRSRRSAATFHLERAIDLDPCRGAALAALDELLVTRGELRRLERVLKRVLFRLRGKGGLQEARPWARLARLYFQYLDNPSNGGAAAANA